jgi:ATP-binding cassette subfamily F protein 3
LLDEPTNHLDLEMRQALANAIQNFTGAIVLVSHDRHLLRVTCNQFLLVDNRAATEYAGDLEDYAIWLKARSKQAVDVSSSTKVVVVPKVPTGTESNKARKKREAQQRQASQPLRNKIKRLEGELTILKQSLINTDEQLADNSLYADSAKDQLAETLQVKSSIQKNIENAEWSWLSASEELELLLGQQS